MSPNGTYENDKYVSMNNGSSPISMVSSPSPNSMMSSPSPPSSYNSLMSPSPPSNYPVNAPSPTSNGQTSPNYNRKLFINNIC